MECADIVHAFESILEELAADDFRGFRLIRDGVPVDVLDRDEALTG